MPLELLEELDEDELDVLEELELELELELEELELELDELGRSDMPPQAANRTVKMKTKKETLAKASFEFFILMLCISTPG